MTLAVGFIYLTKCNVNNKIYIGQRKIPQKGDDSYLGSGLIIKALIKKYGRNNFSREIIEYCYSQEALNDREIYWIKHYKNTHSDLCVNLTEGGQFGYRFNDQKDRYKRTSETNKKNGKVVGNQNWLGRKHSEASKAKISKSRMGMKAPNAGIKHKEESKVKMSEVKKENFRLGVAVASNKGKKLNQQEKDLITVKRDEKRFYVILNENGIIEHINQFYFYCQSNHIVYSSLYCWSKKNLDNDRVHPVFKIKILSIYKK
jgi:group I intron endonuclease